MDDTTANDYADLVLRTLRDSSDERWRQLAADLTEDLAQGRPVAIQRGKRGPSQVDLRRASESAFASTRPLDGLERLDLLLTGLRAAMIDVPEMVVATLGGGPDDRPEGEFSPFRDSVLVFEVPEEVAAEGDRIGPSSGGAAQQPIRVESPDGDEMASIRLLAGLLDQLQSEIETDRLGDW